MIHAEKRERDSDRQRRGLQVVQSASAGVVVQKVEVPHAGQEVTSAGPRFDRQRARRKAPAEAPEITVQDAVIPAFPCGSFFV